MEEQNRYTGNIESSIRKDGGARGSGSGTKKENLYRSDTPDGDHNGIVWTYFRKWSDVFQPRKNESKQPDCYLDISCNCRVGETFFYDFRCTSVKKTGEHKYGIKKEVFKILHCYCGGSADLLCAGGSGYIGCRLF